MTPLRSRVVGAITPRGGAVKRRLLGILLVSGAIAFVAGASILLASLSPMFVARSDANAVTGPNADSLDFATVVAPSPAAAVVRPTPPTATTAAPNGGPIDGVTFEMSVPAIGYRAIVRQGVGTKVLALGPGHYPGTPWPGHAGNVGVAAHNTYWLSFDRLRVGDTVQIRTQHGLFLYQITGWTVVSPTDRTVLAPTTVDRLTLTTCYPLWAGALATKRLVFSARPIGGVT